MTTLQRAAEIYALVNFAVIGLSHVLRPREWSDLFVRLRGQGEASVFAIACLNLLFGSIIVAFHNRWSGLPLVLTLAGWANVAKAALYLTFPAIGMRRLNAISPDRPGVIVVGGAIFLVLAALLAFNLYATRESI